MSTIAKNIAKVRTRIREAAQACGRDPESVGLLAVKWLFLYFLYKKRIFLKV